MAYTEKVSISGTALSFLLYECTNSENGQEGFLVGDVTSEITNHISDSQNDTARLDTQIFIRTVLPLPSASLFYMPTGRIREDVLNGLLSSSASEVVGWYKYRRNSSIKPTFRDKLISKGLQKYFKKYHDKKNFVTCNVTNRYTVSGSTHTFTYRFGKINTFDMYEYIEDVTANLGEKVTGYKKPLRHSSHSIFNTIIRDSNVQNTNASDAILDIQEAVNVRLGQEAQKAAKTEGTIRDLEAEIKQMTTILSEKQSVDLLEAYEKIVQNKFNAEIEMANACAEALLNPSSTNIDITNFLSDNHMGNSSRLQLVNENSRERCPSPILTSFDYAAALKRNSTNNSIPSSSKINDVSEDLMTFDDSPVKTSNDNAPFGGSSPEY